MEGSRVVQDLGLDEPDRHVGLAVAVEDGAAEVDRGSKRGMEVDGGGGGELLRVWL